MYGEEKGVGQTRKLDVVFEGAVARFIRMSLVLGGKRDQDIQPKCYF